MHNATPVVTIGCEFSLLKALTNAIEAVRSTTIACTDASRATWAAPATALPALEATAIAAQTAMVHAKHEFAAALADAQSFISTQAVAPRSENCHA